MANYQATTPEILRNWFTYHPCIGRQGEDYAVLRNLGHELAKAILERVPAGPDQVHAIRLVRTAIMTANAGIACGG